MGELPDKFEPGRILTQTQWMANPRSDTLHVWLHVDDNGEPFFAGRGRGATAWRRNGGPAWEWFVEERLGGCYGVVILEDDLTDADSVALLDRVLKVYNLKLLNQGNPHRKFDYAALGPEGPGPIHYDGVRQLADEDHRLALALEAQQLQYNSNGGTGGECGRFGEVLRDMGAHRTINAFFIGYIVEGYMVQGDVDAARCALDEFLRHAPEFAEHPKIVRLRKIVDRGTFKRRPRKAKV